MAGTQTSVDRIIYQNDVGWGAQNPITITTNSEETYIYILAMGGDPSWYWDKREDLSGIINGKNIATISTIQQSSDISPNLTNYVLSRDVDGSVGSGTYSVTLEDVQSGFLNLTWTNAVSTPGLEVPTNRGFGLGYVFGSGEAALFRISLIDLGISGEFSFSNLTNEVGVKIDKYLGTNNEVVIPSEIDGKPVKIIGRQSFWYNTNISKVILPNSVTKLEEQAFQGCSSLIDINLPEGLTHIGTPETGGAVFYECTSLTNIIFPESLIYLHGSMFQGTKIQKIRVPPAVNFLGPWAFVNASDLEEVKFAGPLPSEVGVTPFSGNKQNLVIKYKSGLFGWTNATNIWPDLNIQPYAAKLTLLTNSLGVVNAEPQPNFENTDFYEAGTQISITAVPTNNYTFSHWSGDYDGTNNPLILNLTTAKTLKANYTLSDLDSDGVSDFRENQDGTNPNDPTDYNSLSGGLLAYFTFENNLNDISGNELNLEQQTGINFVPTRFGYSLKLQGFGAYARSQKNSGIEGNASHSVSFWIFSDNPGNWVPIVIYGGANYVNPSEGNQSSLFTMNNSFVSDNYFKNVQSAEVFDGLQQKWHHFVWTYQTNIASAKMYLNGLPLSCMPVNNGNQSLNIPPGPITIGWPENAPFDGKIDNIRFYNRILTDEEVAKLYKEESGSYDSNSDQITDSLASQLGYSPYFNFLPLIQNLKTNPISGLYNQSQYDANRINGQDDILNNPNSNGLFTTNQIHNLGLGGIILNRDTNNELILNYQVLESTDLVNWTTNSFQMPITNAPTNKMFLRVQALGQ